MRISHPLTPMQRTMLLQSIVGGHSGKYILQMTGLLQEELDPGAFAAAWQEVVNRHDALRASFEWSDADDPRQDFAADVAVPFRLVDLSESDSSEQARAWREFVAEDRARGFEIGTAPLVRVTLFRMGAHRFRFCWSVHHSLVDGRSLLIVLEEVFAAYEAIRSGAAVELPEAPEFRVYLDWLSTQDSREHQEYFTAALDGIGPPESYCFEASSGEGDGGEVTAVVTQESTAALQRVAAEMGVTIHTLVQAAWCAVSSRAQGDASDVVFGAARAGRHVPVEGVESLVGVLINTLPLRANVLQTTTVEDLVQDLRRQGIDLRDHEHVPLSEVSRWLGIHGAPFRSLIAAENFQFDAHFHAMGEAWQARSFELLEKTDMVTLGTRVGDDLTLSLELGAELPRRAGQWMIDHLRDLLDAIPDAGDRPLLSLVPLGDDWAQLTSPEAEEERVQARDLTSRERDQILGEWNQTAVDFDTGRLVHERIGDQAAREPDALAIADPHGELTYGELDRRANRLAHRLQTQGVGPEERVAVCMESSCELLVAYLGILRAGGAYVPVDPGYPEDRIGFLLSDSGARVLLTRSHLEERFGDAPCPVLSIDMGAEFLADESEEAPESGVGPRNLVYVIYTSGSTGTPKGVLIEHRNLTNIAGVYQHRLAVTKNDRAAMIAGVAFDAAVVDIWPYVTAGASLHVPSSDTRVDQRLLVPWLIEQKIDVVFLPTALGEASFLEDWSASSRLRAVLVGGDKLHGSPKNEMPFELHNTYGPTECTVDSTWFTVPTGIDDPAAPPIGRPIENYQAYVVDAYMKPLPVGQKGELLIGGAGVARGYLNREELSAEKFIADPFGTDPEALVYRTGDLVRYREDGEIEFHGRIDDQVQIRGFRVEPGEVAVALNEHQQVEAVAVIAREDRPGKVRLVAYVVSPSPAEDVLPALREFAGKRLPSYMVPSFVSVDELPMTLNGKVDRKALRPPEEYASWRPDAADGGEPTDDVERKLAEIWREVLDLQDVRVSDGFFDLGGDSLSVVSLLVAVEKEFDLEVEVPSLLRDPTIKALARIVRGEECDATRPIVLPLQPDGDLSPFFCVAGAGGGCHWFGDLAAELRHDRPFLGLEPIAVPGGVGHTIEGIASGLVGQIKSMQPAGPYYLGGYSTGGMVAFEMAQQLRERGDEVGLLTLIETDGGRSYTTRAGQVVAFARNLVRMNPISAVKVILDRASFALMTMRGKIAQSADTKVVAARIDARKEQDEQALYAYQPKSYTGDVRVFACEERPMTAVVDEAYGWSDTIQGRIISSKVPGDHYQILGQPSVKTLAKELQASLDAAESRAARGREAGEDEGPGDSPERFPAG